MRRVFLRLSFSVLFTAACGGGSGTNPDAPDASLDSAIPTDGPDGTVADAGGADASTDGGGNLDASIPLDCPSCDADNDGYPAEIDCDDSDVTIYPGTTGSCADECSGGWRTCSADGTWGECNCSPLCEATGSGRCYYISEGGSDSGPGTFEEPWGTYLNLVSYRTRADAPASAVDLAPGDVVYFMDGVYDATFVYGTEQKTFYLQNLRGTEDAPIVLRAYPGNKSVITNSGDFEGIVIQSSSYIHVDGFEVRDTSGKGIMIGASTDIELRHLNVHDVRGTTLANVAGIRMNNSERIEVHHSHVHDIVAVDGGNGRFNSNNIIIFSGGNIRVHHCTFYAAPLSPSDPPLRRAGILYKHSATVPDSRFEVDHNVFRDLNLYAVGSGTFGSRIHHNLFVGTTVRFADFGGDTHNVDNIVENNTFVGILGLDYGPTNNYGPIGLFTYRRNIVVDDGEYNGERGIVTIGTYRKDDVYRDTVTVGNLAFSENCYFNARNEPRWNLFAASTSSDDMLGDIYGFGGWQSLGYDVDSLVTDPMLDANYEPLAPECQDYGWRAP